LASEIERSGRRALALYADVGREADIVRLFSDVDRLFEGLRLVGLVNSAGVGNPSGNVSSFTEASLSALWATNITGTILASREAVKRRRPPSTHSRLAWPRRSPSMESA
jgi:NAD(P)-dependent dehydrogenase (short-subunit alcohol dehydrogenase family)